MTTHDTALFSYIYGSSPIHKIPAEIKIFLILICPPLLFLTNMQICLACMGIILIISRVSGITFSMQIRDIKPIIVYCFFLLFVEIFSGLYAYLFNTPPDLIETPLIASSISSNIATFFTICLPSHKTIMLILHLICTMQFTSLFFKTTTSLHLKEALENIENKMTLGKGSGEFAQTFSLFVTFLPTVFTVWKQINLSWKARAGKNSFSKYLALLPVFISVSLQKAHRTFLALENRK